MIGESAARDRLITFGAALPGVLGIGIGLLIGSDLIQAVVIGLALLLVAAAISLTPPVTAARLRLLRRKYPTED